MANNIKIEIAIPSAANIHGNGESTNTLNIFKPIDDAQ